MADAGDCTLSELYATPRFRAQAVATSIGVIGFNVLGEWLALSSWGKRPADALYRIGYWELERVGKSNSPTTIWSNVLITAYLIGFFITLGQAPVTEAVREGALPRPSAEAFSRHPLLRFVPLRFPVLPNISRALVMGCWWLVVFGPCALVIVALVLRTRSHRSRRSQSHYGGRGG